MQNKKTHNEIAPRPSFALRAAGWASTPLWYLLVVSVLITAARRQPAAH